MEGFIGEIRMFPYNKIPTGWRECDGSLLPIRGNEPLYSIIGTSYGNTTANDFALPNLKDRVPVGAQPASAIGQTGGADRVTLQSSQVPTHSHTFNAATQPTPQRTAVPTANFVAQTSFRPQSGSTVGVNSFRGVAATQSLHSGTLGTFGNGQPHENRQPFLTLSYFICLEGIYPSPD